MEREHLRIVLTFCQLAAEESMIICSHCGALRNEVNHWFIAWTDKNGQRFHVMPMDLDPAMAREEGVQAICGQWCLHQVIEKYTDSVSTRKPTYVVRRAA